MARRNRNCWTFNEKGEICGKPSVVLVRTPMEGYPLSTILNYYCEEHARSAGVPTKASKAAARAAKKEAAR